MIGGEHAWPGTANGVQGTNYDINASEVIWNFFSRYDINGLINPVGIEDSNDITSVDLELSQNFPNPFNPSTEIRFQILDFSKIEKAEIAIYNLKGQKVKTVSLDCIKSVGDNARDSCSTYSVTWNGRNDFGKFVSSGIYFYKLKTDNFEKTRKMILMK